MRSHGNDRSRSRFPKGRSYLFTPQCRPSHALYPELAVEPLHASDEDECALGSHSCPSGTSVCNNQPGSYVCLACPFGANNDSTACMSTCQLPWVCASCGCPVQAINIFTFAKCQEFYKNPLEAVCRWPQSPQLHQLFFVGSGALCAGHGSNKASLRVFAAAEEAGLSVTGEGGSGDVDQSVSFTKIFTHIAHGSIPLNEKAMPDNRVHKNEYSR